MSDEKSSGGKGTVNALARIVLRADEAAFSAAAIRQAQLLLLDTIGCGLAGAPEDVSRAIADVALRDGGKGECPLIGRAEKTGMLNAVLANGVAVRVLDLNDYLIGESKGEPETGGHPSDLIPVALAAGAERRCSGAAILESIIVGYELYARLQEMMNRSGEWDGVSVSGLVAPAMAGRLMGLEEGRLAHAMALGAARAATPSIVRRGDMSAAKSIANALVAQAGVQAALLAERGITGPLAILDDAKGLRDLFADGDREVLTAPIPARSAIRRAHVKTYPCINTGQSAVAAALKLRAMLEGGVEKLSRVEIIMADYRVVKRHQEDPGRIHPLSREAADHSFPFLVAVTLIDGALGSAQFENDRWHDPKVKALMTKIVTSRDAKWNARAPGAYPCTIRASDSGGRDFIAEIPYPPGFSQSGLDDAAVVDKFHSVAASVLDSAARQQIVDAVMEFHHSPSTATLDAAISTRGPSH
ncbi:MAG TPA: MmgE/PrpD family protein [Micropepsaceae bacterium]|nr:MmgE/PrpD family protein [Micropepsaceae bacterium]